MKKVVKASATYEMAHRRASKILRAAQTLLNLMDEAPGDFVDANDLGALYQELIDTIPELSRSLDEGNIYF